LAVDWSGCEAIVLIPVGVTENVIVIKDPLKPYLVDTHWIQERSREGKIHLRVRTDYNAAICHFDVRPIISSSVVIGCINCNLLIPIDQDKVDVLIIVPNLSILYIPIIVGTRQNLLDGGAL